MSFKNSGLLDIIDNLSLEMRVDKYKEFIDILNKNIKVVREKTKRDAIAIMELMLEFYSKALKELQDELAKKEAREEDEEDV